VRRKHHELDAWKVAIELVKKICALSSSLPSHENFGLTARIRRSAVSIPSNIAEGSARLTDREFVRFLGIARGSLGELETQLTIARELGYLDPPEMPQESFG
jgi:four helix bundle protein